MAVHDARTTLHNGSTSEENGLPDIQTQRAIEDQQRRQQIDRNGCPRNVPTMVQLSRPYWEDLSP